MYKYLLLLFLLITMNCFAQEKIISEISIDVAKIDSFKILTEEESIVVKESLEGKIYKQLEPVKNDYINEYERGTVKHREDFRNYSFQNVVIPDGTIIKNSNFTQKEPHTNSIQGKNLVFENCNLKNVLIDETWTLNNSLSVQAYEEEIVENNKSYKIYYVENKDTKNFEEVSREEIISSDIISK